MERTLRKNGNYEMVMIMTSLLTSLFWITLMYSTRMYNSNMFSIHRVSIENQKVIQSTYAEQPESFQTNQNYKVLGLNGTEESFDFTNQLKVFEINTENYSFNQDEMLVEELSLQQLKFKSTTSELEEIQEDFDIDTELSTIQIPAEENNNAVNYINIDELKIYKDMHLNERTGLSKEDFAEVISKMKYDYSGFFKENNEYIYDLCERYELNEIFFCGLIAAESGWDIKDNHRKANNFTSISVNGKMIKYDSVQEGLEAGAKLLHEEYLTEGGKYYNGENLADIKVCYNPESETWEDLVYGCMRYIVE